MAGMPTEIKTIDDVEAVIETCQKWLTWHIATTAERVGGYSVLSSKTGLDAQKIYDKGKLSDMRKLARAIKAAQI